MKITRSSKLHLNYSNREKLNILNYFFQKDIEDSCIDLINHLIYLDDIPKFLDKDTIEKFLPFGGRVGQLLAKECSSVARSLKAKIDKTGSHNLPKYLYEIKQKFESNSLSVSSISQYNLDSRFITIEENHSSKEFGYWISINYPNIGKVKIPFKKTSHMKKLEERGFSLKNNTLRIKKNGGIELCYEKSVETKTGGEKIGVDVGRNKSFYCSDGKNENTTKDILNSLKAMKHGSKNKASRVRKLKQAIDKEIKNIDFSNLLIVYLERLNGMKPGKKWGNINHHWSYRYIQNRIELHCEEHGVHVQYVAPAYTSQTCSSCGHKHKMNRKGEKFECLSCGIFLDADYNASKNILQRGINSTHFQRK